MFSEPIAAAKIGLFGVVVPVVIWDIDDTPPLTILCLGAKAIALLARRIAQVKVMAMQVIVGDRYILLLLMCDFASKLKL